VGFVRDEGVKTRHKGFIWGMSVHPDRRGQGIGRVLVVEALKQIDAILGLRRVRLSVTSTKGTAEALYESLGFVCYGVEDEARCVDGVYLGEHHLVRLVGKTV